jgi:alkylation response protein AidB-like acyl-CoA dehydrogenase
MRASSELRLLEDAAEHLLAEHYPVSRLRAMIADETQYQDGVRELRRRAGGLGWFGFLVPEEFGGGSLTGRGVLDAALIAKQRGRGLAPGPFADIHVAAAAIAGCGSHEQQAGVLPELASGDRVVACAFSGTLGRSQYPPVRVAESAGAVVLDGQVRPVAHAAQADTLLLWVSDAGRTRRFLVPADSAGVTIRPLQGLDLTGRAYQVSFGHMVLPRSAELVPPAGPEPETAADVAIGTVLTAADSVGAMDRILEMTVEYARTRQAFGRAIGSFQAVKHQIADLSMLVAASQAVTEAATEALAAEHRDAVEIASIAKAFVSDQSHQVGQGCLQLHGGIGYAWEHDLHLYLRRLAANGATYGSARHHREAIAARHLGSAEASR